MCVFECISDSSQPRGISQLVAGAPCLTAIYLPQDDNAKKYSTHKFTERYHEQYNFIFLVMMMKKNHEDLLHFRAALVQTVRQK